MIMNIIQHAGALQSKQQGQGPLDEQNKTGCDGANSSKFGRSDKLITGPSCKALKTAVSALYSVDDFIKEKIGSGFFSEVYKVTHRVTGQVMVLKMNQLRSNRPNMLREVQLLNKLSHPNILRFMGVCVQEGQLHALTEYIADGSLEQLIQNKSEPLLPVEKMRLALGIAEGMKYVHESGVFHRDLTSKNVLVRKLPDGILEAVVGDFGLAAKIPKKSSQRLDTVGSPYWMSPECLNGCWYDQTSDIFSYGIILCELIARISADPDFLPRTSKFSLDYMAFVDLCPNDTPPAFLRICFHCCIYEPESRYKFEEVISKLSKLIDNHNEFYLKNEMNCDVNGAKRINKRNSVDFPFCMQQNQEKMKNDLEMVEESLSSLQHRRSLSENVIAFPSHTTPSDKARCHPLNRDLSRSNQTTKTYSMATLRKEAELMLLMDAHYKPCQKKDTNVNPFTALAQLRGVKKILGANNVPTSLTIDSSDLFSSCFERTSPFLEDLKDFNNSNNSKSLSNKIEINLPKSLPNSPQSSRKFLLEPTVVESVKRPEKKYKSKFPELSSHPLYKGNCGVDAEPLKSFLLAVPQSSDEKKQKKTTITASATHSYSKLVDKSEVDSNLVYDVSNLNLLTRRGSTESGFYSCLNEDFSSSRTSCLCPNFNHNCYRFLRKDDITEVSNITLNDSSSVANTSATVSSLRSLDDLDLTESKKRNQNLNQIDLDARSVDIGLLNRLALDTEINSFIQKSQFSNQLLYCKNRTSSIYTDSSDDISSLAGSDSLWDEGCGFINNTRSAQIAKIVEYFERKGQNFKTNFSVPESLKPQHTCIISDQQHPAHHLHHHQRSYYTNYSTDSRNKFLCNYFNVIQRDYELNNVDLNSATSSIAKDLLADQSEQASGKNDYESFCLELDKKSPQNLKICDGLVKSKLEFFDKLKKGSPVEK